MEIPSVRSAAMEGLFTYLSRENPLEAVAYWEENHEEMPDITEQSPFFHSFVRRLIEIDDNPQQLLNRLPEEWHGKALTQYVTSAGSVAPDETLRFLEALPESREREAAIRVSLSQWVDKDPALAAEWVDGLADGRQKELATSQVVEAWAQQDFKEAQAWLIEQPPSAGWDRGAASIIQTSWLARPEDAISLAASISDEGLRNEVLQETVINLARRNPYLAAEQVEPAGLGAELREKVEQERVLREYLEAQERNQSLFQRMFFKERRGLQE